jgi:hypothetical protein
VVTDLAEGGDEATRSAARAQRATRASHERHRPAVGGDDQALGPEQRRGCGTEIGVGLRASFGG